MLGRIFGLPVMMRSTPSISDSLGRRTTNCSQSHGARNESSLLPTWTIRASLHCSKPTVPASSCSAEARTLTERCLRCSTGSWPAPPHSASNTQSLSSIASASVAAPFLSASNRQCQSAGQSVVSTTRRTAAACAPCRCQLSELPSEALSQMAVVSARRAGRKDRITRPELQGEAAPAQDAFRLKPEAWTPCKQRHEFTERPSIEPSVAKQRERSREFQRSVGRTRPFDAFADQSSPLRLADQRPRVPLDFDPHNGRAEEERLNQREVAP